jgi:Ca-activated chloride channel homolog
MRYLWLSWLFGLLSAGEVYAEAQKPTEQVMLVLDASGSMWGQLNGKTKIEIARAAVADLTGAWPAHNPLGLVTYGHRSKGDCQDIETLLPVAPLNRSTYLSKVNALNPKGMTPISAAVMHAAEALKYSEQKATVILVSDGEETCNLDPCEVGRSLEAKGVDFVAHVIGFDVPNPKHQDQLKCLAENTGGRYFNARDAGDLSAALQTLARTPTSSKLPPATATLAAPEQAPILSAIRVRWTGPADTDDFVALSRKQGASYTDYDFARIEKSKPEVTLSAPAVPGVYALRYVSLQRAQPVLAERPIQIVDAEVNIDAPAQVSISQRFKVRARGPFGSGSWVGFAPKGAPIGSYLDYARPTSADGELELSAPANAGEYELRYVLNESERIAFSRAIRVTEGEAQITVAAQVQSGNSVAFTARGPIGSGHWIGFAEKGAPISSYLDYLRPEADVSSYQLTAPSQPGDYELRYVLNESERIITAVPVKVLDGPVTLSAPGSAKAGAVVKITASGPVSGRNWIGFAPQGSDAGAYRDYAYVTQSPLTIELRAPDEPGDYELRYVLNNERVIYKQAFKVD